MSNNIIFAEFKNDLEKNLKEVANKYGLNVKTGKITYTNKDFSLKLEFNQQNFGSFDDVNFLNNYHKFPGIKLEHLHKMFMYNGKVYKIIGLNEGSKKYPIKAKSGSKILFFNSGVLNNLIEEL